MAASGPILRAGLTGGIASGKSTVAGILAGLGAFVVDADELAARAMAPGGPTHAAILKRFGSSIGGSNGTIDRTRLGARVFTDPAELEALNAIVHPLVRSEVARLFALCAERGLARVAVLDAALLVETGFYRELDRLIVLSCSPETQRSRLQEGRGLNPEEADARIASQASLEQKLAVADYVIETDGPLEQTRSRTARVWESLLADYDSLVRT
jgi:dephospho-CoA kinase